MKWDIATIQQQLTAWRRELHQYPELSGQEVETTARLKKWLNRYGIETSSEGLSTGLVAEIGSGHNVIALRADIDALPIFERHQSAHRSVRDGVMHACGHDLHSAVILGAAILLKQHEATLAGRVRIIFQPAEETYAGASAVIAAGLLQGVQAIFGMHNEPNLPLGTFATRAGAFYANVDRFNIKLKGQGAHAGRPHEGQDVIVIASQLINALQSIISRSIDTLDTAVLSVTQIHAGNTWNVLPEIVHMEGTARTHQASTRALLEEKTKHIAQGMALAYGIEIEVDWQHGPSAVINSPEWAAFSAEVALAQGYHVVEADLHLGGEDFAAYLDVVPGAFVSIGSGSVHGLHHPEFAPDDALILPAAQYFSSLAIQALQHLQYRD